MGCCRYLLPLVSSVIVAGGVSYFIYFEKKKNKKNKRVYLPQEIILEKVYFPQEIIVEILTRVDVKSLLRYRCVSKSWCYLIDSQQFALAHLEMSRKLSSCGREQLMLLFKTLNQDLKFFPPSSLLCENLDDVVDVEIPVEDLDHFRILGCCNGIVLIRMDKNRFYLLNPSTRDLKKLPLLHDDEKEIRRCEACGFGFDESTLDYKVIFVESKVGVKVGSLYSWKRHCWKQIMLPDLFYFEYCIGTYWRGKVYWCNQKRMYGPPSSIVSFDLSKEVFESIQVRDPPESYGKEYYWSKLGIVEESLCALSHTKTLEVVDLWMLKAQQGCWERRMRIPFNPYSRMPSMSHVVPIDIRVSGTILLWCSYSIWVYDSNDKSVKFLDLKSCSKGSPTKEMFYLVNVYAFVPSLLKLS